MYRLFFILILSALPVTVFAQSTLVPGDIAFVAVNSDGSDDQFAFVLLTDIQNSTEINLTDNGWMSAGAFNTVYPESHFTWTATSDMLAGDLIFITTYNGNALATASVGTITGEKMTVSVAGDQLLAYQGSKTDPNFIAAISFNQNQTVEPGLNFDDESVSNASTALPVGLEIGLSAIHIYSPSDFAEQDNSRYNCLLTQGTKEELLAAINNKSNWMMDNDIPFPIDPFSCAFTVDVPTEIILKQEEGGKIKWVKEGTQLVVTFNTEEASELFVFNTRGSLVKTERKREGQLQVQLTIVGWKSGLYLMQVVYKDEKKVYKIVL